MDAAKTCIASTEELTEFLTVRIGSGDLGDTAEGIARLVLASGESHLSDAQQYVFHRYVISEYADVNCKMCQRLIPLSEAITALAFNDGYCGDCAYAMAKP